MTNEEKIENFIKKNFESVEDKPKYVWFSKRKFQIISIETLRKTLCEASQVIDKYEVESENFL